MSATTKNLPKDAAFLILYTKEGFYQEQGRILFSWRFNSEFGFSGGEVDDGETPIQAAVRECFEETNYQLSEKEIAGIEPLSVFKTDQGNTIYSYHLELSKEKLFQIAGGSFEAKDLKFESCGFNTYMLYDQSLENLMLMPFSGTARKELKLLLEKMGYSHKTMSLDDLFSRDFYIKKTSEKAKLLNF